MLTWLRNIFITDDDNDPAFAKLVRNILIVIFVILVLLAITQTGILTGTPQLDAFIVLSGIAIVTGYIIYLANKMILWPGKVFLPVALLVSLTYFTVTENGLHDVTMIGFPAVIFTASLLLGRRTLLFWAIVTSACVGFIGFWDIAGFTPDPIARTTGVDTVAVGILVIFAVAGIAWLLLQRFEEIIASARENEQSQIEANQGLRSLQSTLEERIADRTNELEQANQRNEQRAQQFEAITLVGNAISSVRSLEDLLPRVTELISQQFGYYHAGIFLSDANNEFAVLSAANSEGGQRMLKRGHQLKVGEQGIVGYVTSAGKPRIALDVGHDAVYFDNPDMPDTRSEMALPLKIGETIVGALDVQSTEASAFSEDDINVLSLLADQVSLAIENARLFDQARKSMAESEALYRQYIRQAWTRLPKEQNLAGFRYNVRGASPIDTRLRPDIAKGSDIEADEYQSPRVSVPIAIRGETIGTLSVQIPDSSTFSDDQMDLVNAVAERVALSAENARLFEETTRRAERERLVSDITVKIRGTNDPDAMIQTALEELKHALGASKVQLIPHTLQKKEAQQLLENPTPLSQSDTSRKNRKK